MALAVRQEFDPTFFRPIPTLILSHSALSTSSSSFSSSQDLSPTLSSTALAPTSSTPSPTSVDPSSDLLATPPLPRILVPSNNVNDDDNILPYHPVGRVLTGIVAIVILLIVGVTIFVFVRLRRAHIRKQAYLEEGKFEFISGYRVELSKEGDTAKSSNLPSDPPRPRNATELPPSARVVDSKSGWVHIEHMPQDSQKDNFQSRRPPPLQLTQGPQLPRDIIRNMSTVKKRQRAGSHSESFNIPLPSPNMHGPLLPSPVGSFGLGNGFSAAGPSSASSSTTAFTLSFVSPPPLSTPFDASWPATPTWPATSVASSEGNASSPFFDPQQTGSIQASSPELLPLEPQEVRQINTEEENEEQVKDEEDSDEEDLSDPFAEDRFSWDFKCAGADDAIHDEDHNVQLHGLEETVDVPITHIELKGSGISVEKKSDYILMPELNNDNLFGKQMQGLLPPRSTGSSEVTLVNQSRPQANDGPQHIEGSADSSGTTNFLVASYNSEHHSPHVRTPNMHTFGEDKRVDELLPLRYPGFCAFVEVRNSIVLSQLVDCGDRKPHPVHSSRSPVASVGGLSGSKSKVMLSTPSHRTLSPSQSLLKVKSDTSASPASSMISISSQPSQMPLANCVASAPPNPASLLSAVNEVESPSPERRTACLSEASLSPCSPTALLSEGSPASGSSNIQERKRNASELKYRRQSMYFPGLQAPCYPFSDVSPLGEFIDSFKVEALPCNTESDTLPIGLSSHADRQNPSQSSSPGVLQGASQQLEFSLILTPSTPALDATATKLQTGSTECDSEEPHITEPQVVPSLSSSSSFSAASHTLSSSSSHSTDGGNKTFDLSLFPEVPRNLPTTCC